MSDMGVRPIWYPTGQHGLIADLLAYLADQAGQGAVEPLISERLRRAPQFGSNALERIRLRLDESKYFEAVVHPIFDSLQKITEDFMEYTRLAEKGFAGMEERRERLLTERNKIRAFIDQMPRRGRKGRRTDHFREGYKFKESPRDPYGDFVVAAFFLLHCDHESRNMSPNHATLKLLEELNLGLLDNGKFRAFLQNCRDRCQKWWGHLAHAYFRIKMRSIGH
jgi:hypothetical protein